MEQRPRFILVICFACTFSSCLTDLGEETHYIRFNDLQVGQESRYVRLHGYRSGDPTTNIAVLVPDTLVVRVIGEDAQGYVLEDFLTAKPSERYHPPEDTTVYTYHLTVRNDTVRAIGNSHLFWNWSVFAMAATFPLKPVAEPHVSVTGWKLSIDPIGFGRGHAYATNVSISGHWYDRVNVWYEGFDIDYLMLEPAEDYRIGASFIFSSAYGIIRSRYTGSPGLGEGLCWDLIW